MFNKILIANRGEIACRVIQTARRMGIATVAVYSDADASARHVRLADEAVHIGPAPARESYLVGANIIAAAKATGAQAIHPGYGFLSENDDFAEACAEAGIVFIGPPRRGDPRDGLEVGRQDADGQGRRAADARLPRRRPGSGAASRAQAEQIGFPVLIKASAGGGGKGMRRVDKGRGFRRRARLVPARGEERVRRRPRAGRAIRAASRATSRSRCSATRHGNCVYLFERDCSVQRRHQKVIEEAPAPA